MSDIKQLLEEEFTNHQPPLSDTDEFLLNSDQDDDDNDDVNKKNNIGGSFFLNLSSQNDNQSDSSDDGDGDDEYKHDEESESSEDDEYDDDEIEYVNNSNPSTDDDEGEDINSTDDDDDDGDNDKNIDSTDDDKHKNSTKKKSKKSLNDINSKNKKYFCGRCDGISKSWVILVCPCKSTYFCTDCYEEYCKAKKVSSSQCIISLKCDHCNDGKELDIKQIQYSSNIQRIFESKILVPCRLCDGEFNIEGFSNHVKKTCLDNSKNLKKSRINFLVKNIQNSLNKYNRKKSLHESKEKKKEAARNLLLATKTKNNPNVPNSQKKNAIDFVNSNKLYDDHRQQKTSDFILNSSDDSSSEDEYDSFLFDKQSIYSSYEKRKRKHQNPKNNNIILSINSYFNKFDNRSKKKQKINK